MGKRTNDLTLAAQPVAEDLMLRCGSLKHILSAGVMALNELEPDEREAYMKEAAALEMPKRAGVRLLDIVLHSKGLIPDEKLKKLWTETPKGIQESLLLLVQTAHAEGASKKVVHRAARKAQTTSPQKDKAGKKPRAG